MNDSDRIYWSQVYHGEGKTDMKNTFGSIF
jgi:hypothetical protein